MNLTNPCKLLGLTKRQLEQLTGVSYSVWWRLENPVDSRKKKPATLLELCRVLVWLKREGLLENYFAWRAGSLKPTPRH